MSIKAGGLDYPVEQAIGGSDDRLSYFQRRCLGQSKSLRTRAAIMDAAMMVFARDGYDAAAISMIAKIAGVANGTFYIYFQNKEQLVLELGNAMAAHIADTIDEAVKHIDRIDLRLSASTQHYISEICADKSWGLAFYKMFAFMPNLRLKGSQHLRRDIKRGIDEGVFHVQLDDLLVDMIGSITRAAIFDVLACGEPLVTDYPTKAQGILAAEMQLRMLGINKSKAGRLSLDGAMILG